MSLSGALATATLVVSDIDRAKDFYGGTLGFEELGQLADNETGVAYKCGQGTYLYVYERDRPSGSTATACAFGVDYVERTVKELRGRGIEFEEYDIPEMGLKTIDGVATQGRAKTAWFNDPFGNILAVDNSSGLLRELAESSLN